jgi:hypothetical protein
VRLGAINALWLTVRVQSINRASLEKEVSMWRMVKMLSPLILLSLAGCLPGGYFESLLGNSISGIFSVLLSDALNVLVPPI